MDNTKEKEKLLKLIDTFLAEYRKANGGWAKIEDSDVELLYKIIDLLIELKCEGDEKNSRPIDYHLVNRRKRYFVVSPVTAKYDADDNDLFSVSVTSAALAESLTKLIQIKMMNDKEKRKS